MKRDGFYEFSVINDLLDVSPKGVLTRDIVKTLRVIKGTKWEYKGKFYVKS